MKTILGLLAVLSLSNVMADSRSLPEYYSAHFEVVKVEPICGKNPGGMSCMAVGDVVTLRAVLNCADSLVYKKFTVVGTDIAAVSVVAKHPDSDRIRCFKANEVFEKVQILNGKNTQVINLDITPAR
jgi:hypothetical protein